MLRVEKYAAKLQADLDRVHEFVILFVGVRNPVLEWIIVNGSNIPSSNVYGRQWS